MKTVLRSWLFAISTVFVLSTTRSDFLMDWEWSLSLDLFWLVLLMPLTWRALAIHSALEQDWMKRVHVAGSIGLLACLFFTVGAESQWLYQEIGLSIGAVVHHAIWALPLGIVLLHRGEWPRNRAAAAFSTLSMLALAVMVLPRVLGVPLQEEFSSVSFVGCDGDWSTQAHALENKTNQIAALKGPESAAGIVSQGMTRTPCLDTPSMRLHRAQLRSDAGELTAAITEVEYILETTEDTALRGHAWELLSQLREERGDYRGAYLAAARWLPYITQTGDRETRVLRNFWLGVFMQSRAR